MSLALCLAASMERAVVTQPVNTELEAPAARAILVESQSAMAFEDAENYELTNEHLSQWDPTKPSPTNSIDQARSFMYVNLPPQMEQNFGKVGEWKDNTAALRNVKDLGYMADYLCEPMPSGVNAELHKPKQEPGFVALPRNF